MKTDGNWVGTKKFPKPLCQCSSLIDEEIKTQRVLITCPRSLLVIGSTET